MCCGSVEFSANDIDSDDEVNADEEEENVVEVHPSDNKKKEIKVTSSPTGNDQQPYRLCFVLKNKIYKKIA